MEGERRIVAVPDRRARPRSGRRAQDRKKPWYMRRRLWLAAASLMYVGWRRVRRLARAGDRRNAQDRAA